MKILAIESSSLVASVAIVDSRVTLGEFTVNHKKTHSQTLLPMIDELFKITDIDKSSIEAIAVAEGPGSFTGLRIGGATAKGLALALDVPIIPVSTLEAIAYNMYKTPFVLAPILDAKRNQVYSAVYVYEDIEKPAGINVQTDGLSAMYEVPHFNIIHEPSLIEVNILVDRLTKIYEETGRQAIVMGDGAVPFARYLDEYLKVPHTYAPMHLNRPRAAAVAALAYYYCEKEGRKVNSDDFVPVYLRASQAELVKQGVRLS